ncbi:uncharacterized protein Eint_041320 [Encephalitozoon intestinalis ATCC 50506]|uniref:CCAAT-binding factor domain-containing protein n=1 Tax=Encephalitozoon intestinalis (strain ATCC 50506) TaxID=876142 RepID=E0S6T6_ENCIT|nr:uncharacterized protein Eint_041320 [Encephalitozoon intestinalis ATCC 50506]ADM11421.1 hypothetical protein Eint_041320 [Encephalitozoon intestinalis ATCC 50506]UTX45113.1 hypothetical protein GPK93_04g06510 [Encephalitozoon intestinalis]
MDEAVEKLELVLESKVENLPEKIMDALEDLVQASLECSSEEMVEYELDEILINAFDKTSHKDHKRLMEMLLDLMSCMRDPRNIYPAVEKYFSPECNFSMDAAKVIFVMKRDFGFEFDGFLSTLLDCIRPENIENDTERRLFFILMVLDNGSVPLVVTKAFVKKLCNVSLQVKSSCCHKILWGVLWIMRFHPMAYAMAKRESFEKDLEWNVSVTINQFQPYLFELDILSESLKGIQKVVSLIKREAMDAKNRPKLLSLDNVIFPKLEI